MVTCAVMQENVWIELGELTDWEATNELLNAIADGKSVSLSFLTLPAELFLSRYHRLVRTLARVSPDQASLIRVHYLSSPDLARVASFIRRTRNYD